MKSDMERPHAVHSDRPGWAWAGNSLALALWLVSVLLWCVLMRQSLIAMPWDEMSTAGMRLHDLRRPFALAGMSVGMLGTAVCLGCLFWLCLSVVIGAGWGVPLRRVLAAGCWGAMPGVLVLAGTVGCLTTVVFPETALYWGVDGGVIDRVQAFGVLDWTDRSWWNPAWLYLRMGLAVLLAWSMAQIWKSRAFANTAPGQSIGRGMAAVCLVVTVMVMGMLGFDVLAAGSSAVLSMFPVYFIVYSLFAGLAFAVLAGCLLRRLDGGRHLPWPRLGGLLLALVLVKGYLVYSQYLVIWYASISGELALYSAGGRGLPTAAFGLELLVPFIVLMFPSLRRNPAVLGYVCAGILAGSLLEACWLLFPGLDLILNAWTTWLPLGALAVVVGGACVVSVWGALSARRVFP